MTENNKDTRDLLNNLQQRDLTRRSLLRTSAIAAGAIAITPLLAACGDDDDDEPTATSAPAEATDAPTEAEDDGDAEETEETDDEEPTSEATDPPAEGGRGGRLVHVRSSDSDSLDPHRTVSGESWLVFSNIYDTLISKNMDLEFEPLIAESWEISEDGMDYTFVIRDGMKFHDGTPVDAEAVKFTFDRLIDPDLGAPGRGWIQAFTGSDLVDDKTLVMHLEEPFSPFMSNIAVEYFGIISPTGVETHGADFGTNPVGSGPWMFKEWREGEQITLVPNPDYTNYRSFVNNTGAPLADELVFRVIPDASTQIAAVETGEANHIGLPSSEVRNFKDDPDYNVIFTSGGTNIYYLEFVTTPVEGQGMPEFKAPFDDIRVRQAVGHAINMEEIIDTIMEGIGDRNYGLMPTGLFAYDPAIQEFGFEYDPEKAASLLEEAGWTMSGDVRQKDGQSLDLVFWLYSNPTNERVVQVFQSHLAQVGIKINIEVMEIGTMIARLPEGVHDIDLVGVGWPEPDILHLISSFPFGLGQYRVDEYMDAITEARQVSDLEERKALYFEAQKIALADAAAIPLWTDLAVIMTRAEVKGFHLGPDNVFVWVDAWVED